MVHGEHSTRRVRGTVQEVLPVVGLAYVQADGCGTWAITKSTRGVGLDGLQEGQRVEMVVEDHTRFSLVREYAAIL